MQFYCNWYIEVIAIKHYQIYTNKENNSYHTYYYFQTDQVAYNLFSINYEIHLKKINYAV